MRPSIKKNEHKLVTFLKALQIKAELIVFELYQPINKLKK